MTFGPGVPSQSLRSWEAFLNTSLKWRMLGDAAVGTNLKLETPQSLEALEL